MTPFSIHTQTIDHSQSMSFSEAPLLLFCNRWLGRQGGAERYLLEIAQGLQQRGFRCLLLYLEEGHEAASCSDFFTSCIKLQAPEEMERYAIQLSPQWIYLHQWPYQQLSSPALQRFSRWVHVHDSALLCPREHKYFLSNGQTCHHPMGWRCAVQCGQIEMFPGLASWMSNKTQRNFQALQSLQHADRILCGSAYLSQMLALHELPKERITTLPLALPYERSTSSTSVQEKETLEFHPLQKQTPSETKDIPRILFVGSLLRSKGLDLLLHALWRLKEPFLCEMIGHGAQEAGFRALAKVMGFGRGLRKDQQIHFLGWRSPQELQSFYQNADLLAFPSRSPETFGLVGLEAMHHALPVVAFDVGGISEWLQHAHTGYLVPSGDTQGFAEALKSLLIDEKKRRNLGKNAQKRAQEAFSFEKHLDTFQKYLFDDLLKKKS